MRRPIALPLTALLFTACSAASPAPLPASTPPATRASTATAALPTATASAALTLAATPSTAPTSSGPSPAGSGTTDAGARLLSYIPPSVRQHCKEEPFGGLNEQEPGELASVACEYPSGSLVDYATYELYDSKASMDAYYDLQAAGITNAGTVDGPGCGKGPGPGTSSFGRAMCYLFLVDDAQIQWTLFVRAHAWNDDGDFGKLDEWWKTAGPNG